MAGLDWARSFMRRRSELSLRKPEITLTKQKNPVLLFVDNHASHINNLKVIDLARNNGVVLLCFSPHCSHRLQPLDVAFMNPLSLYYEEESRKWLRTHPGKVFFCCANMRTALNGFEKTETWPVNTSTFTNLDFLSSITTDIELEFAHIDVTEKDMVSTTTIELS
ncbi:hypothetical protein ILUMI_00272 [Ignelater luminosus]|uniref:DDE-1 domain-containing protein n=1 Tax=Ignelater luminosus TaxID=2038154 RepID=A0A8K0DLX9_IGNLU|nr:hypothetical protein ILUMI_00272 [Ignelater luminosus]